MMVGVGVYGYDAVLSDAFPRYVSNSLGDQWSLLRGHIGYSQLFT